MAATSKTKKTAAAAVPAKKTVKVAASAKKTAVPVKKTTATAEKDAAPAPEKKVTDAKKTAKTKTVVPAVPAKKTAKKVAPKSVSKVAPKVQKVVSEEVPVKQVVHRKLKLTKTLKKKYIDALMKLRAEFLCQLQFHQDDALSSKKDAAGERAGMATHMADLGSDNFRHDLELSLLSDEGDVIVMIDEALQRINDSEYGICVECGCEISPARLEAKPYARFCTKCKSMHEQMEDPLKRHR